jgi:hypothetical protein
VKISSFFVAFIENTNFKKIWSHKYGPQKSGPTSKIRSSKIRPSKIRPSEIVKAILPPKDPNISIVGSKKIKI